ncbi:MAG: HAD hydrolase-like protein, partial [Rhodospirillales bacterium]|nr:HAD hydrolase-like protein [Rhodospirillales bacterium]
ALIGDSATDLDTARAAGVACVLVSYGYTTTPAGDLGPDVVIDHAADLPSALTSL